MKVFLLALAASASAVRDRKECPLRKASFLQKPEPDTAKLGLPFDGYFEVGCFLDQTPDARVMKFKKTARGSSAEARAQLATPQQCFNYCRDKSKDVSVAEELLEGSDTDDKNGVSHTVRMNFFGLTKGKDCYCIGGPQLTASGGGMGKCDAVCDGDNSKFCGNSKGKSTVYSMHHCAGGERFKDAEALHENLDQLAKKNTASSDDLSSMVSAGYDAVNGLPVASSRQFLSEQLQGLKDARRDLDESNEAVKAARDALKGAMNAYDPNHADASDSDKLAIADDANANATEMLTLGNSERRAFDDYQESVSMRDFMRDHGMDLEKIEQGPTGHVNVRRGDVPSGGTYLVEGDAGGFFYMGAAADHAEYICATACTLHTQCVGFNIIKTESKNKDWMCSMKKNVKKVVMFPDENSMAVTGGINLPYFELHSKTIEFDKSHFVDV